MSSATISLSKRHDLHLVEAAAVRVRPWDTWAVAAATATISMVAYLYYQLTGKTLLYPDSIAHLEIARRFFDSPTPGFGQLGGVWLPLPHLLSVPFIWIDPLYYSGLAGSLVSMVSYIVTGVFLYKIVKGLTGYRQAGVVGAAVFALNPNVLYMQSTPMTEMLLFACMAMMVYFVQTWIQTNDYRSLLHASMAALAGSLTRYEAWILIAVMSGVVGIVAWKRHSFRHAIGKILSFAFLGWIGIIGWVLWNWLIFANPLNWQNGAYAKSSLWVGSDEPAVGNLVVSLKTYWYAVVDNLGLVVLVVTGIGAFALLCLRRKLDVLPTAALMVQVPFFVTALYGGQRPMHVMELNGNLYNARFGLIVALVAAIVIGYAMSLFAKLNPKVMIATVVIVCMGLAGSLAISGRPVLVNDAAQANATRATEWTNVASFMQAHYKGGKVLAMFFGNESVLFGAHIALGDNIYEGSYKQWNETLDNPTSHDVKWIIMRGSADDEVYAALHNSPKLSSYTLVYDQHGYQVYEAR